MPVNSTEIDVGELIKKVGKKFDPYFPEHKGPVLLPDKKPASEGRGALANVTKKIDEVRNAIGLKSNDPEKDKLFVWGVYGGLGLFGYKILKRIVK